MRKSSLCKNYGIQKDHRLLAIFTHPEIIPLVKDELIIENF